MQTQDEEISKAFQTEFWRILSRFSYISTFRILAISGMEYSKTSMINEAVDLLNFSIQSDLLTAEGRAGLSNADMQKWFVDTHINNRTYECLAVIDSASLVVAQSIVDGSLYNCLRITAMIAPSDWEPFVAEKPIPLGQLKERPYCEILESQIHRQLLTIERESVIQKAEMLFRICKPGPGFNPFVDQHKYKFDKTRLIEIDNSRHEIVHGDKILKSIDTIENDISFLQDTAVFFWGMLNKTYGLKIDTTQTIVVAKEELGF